MNSPNPKTPVRPQETTREQDAPFISYQGNKVPWWIHLMWAAFAVAGMIYLFRLAIPDFIRWW